MRVLITNNTLAAYAGSELVVVEVAKALQARGHEVAACSCNIGPAGALLREEQVVVIREPGDSPFLPDILHGQHHLDTMRAVLRLPETPAIFHCHGGLPWIERPPVHPRILRYIGMCEVTAAWMQVELGLDPDRVHTLPNWVDTRRFHTVRCPPERPRKALVFTRMVKPGYFAGVLADAFKERGIELDLTVPGGSGETRHPESLLPDYDIVLAAGRSALEAMACGCATMPVSAHACLGFVEPGNFDRMRAANFAPGRAEPQWTRESILAQLDAYDAERAAAVTRKIRAEATLDLAVDRLEEIYRATLADWAGAGLPSKHEEMRAASDYLNSLMPILQNLGDLWKTEDERFAIIEDQYRSLEALGWKSEARERRLELRESEIRALKQQVKSLVREIRHHRDARAITAELRRGIAGRIMMHFARKRAKYQP